MRYLIGCLYINLTLLWEPITALIKSHALGMDVEEFWDVWTPFLENSASASGSLFFCSISGCVFKFFEHQTDSIKLLFLVEILLNPEKSSEMDEDDERDIVGVYKDYRKLHIRGPDDRPDEPNFRFLLWKAMHSFPEVCEPKSKIITPLFFNFLE